MGDSVEGGRWDAVLSAVVAGLGHDLADRAASLQGLFAMAEVDDELADLLRGELKRLTALVELIRALPRSGRADAEPLRLGEALAPLAALTRRQRGLERVEVEIEESPATPPVLVDPEAFGRATMLLLGAAARAAVRSGASGVRVRCDGDASSARLEIGLSGAAPPGDDAPPDAAESAALAAVRDLAAGLAGELEVEPAGVRGGVTLRLPSLEAARRAGG